MRYLLETNFRIIFFDFVLFLEMKLIKLKAIIYIPDVYAGRL